MISRVVPLVRVKVDIQLISNTVYMLLRKAIVWSSVATVMTTCNALVVVV